MNAKRERGMLSEKPRLALVPSEGWRGRRRGRERERERIRPRALSELFAPYEQSENLCPPLARERTIRAKEIDQSRGDWVESDVSAKGGLRHCDDAPRSLKSSRILTRLPFCVNVGNRRGYNRECQDNLTSLGSVRPESISLIRATCSTPLMDPTLPLQV